MVSNVIDIEDYRDFINYILDDGDKIVGVNMGRLSIRTENNTSVIISIGIDGEEVEITENKEDFKELLIAYFGIADPDVIKWDE